MHEGDGHLWAVSYADLLMVLMSFFVIFFSFSDDNKNLKNGDLMMEISEGLKAKITGTATAAKDTLRSPSAMIDRSALESLGAEVLESGKSIYVNLPDDIFSKRQFELSSSTKEKLNSIFKALEPNAQKIELVVIGHADSSRVSSTQNPYLSNNFDLSSLRALKAVEYFIGEGFPENHISAQGSSYGLRNSRTLSIRVRVKEELI